MKTKCARWCGRGCTQEEYEQAVCAAEKLVVGLSRWWKPCVMENLGWHASAESPCGRVWVKGKGRKYTALFGEAGTHAGQWVASGKTAKGAVAAVIAKVQAERDKLTAWIEEARR